jgi:3-oxoacyl-[acyl-carrier protein] reductase
VLVSDTTTPSPPARVDAGAWWRDRARLDGTVAIVTGGAGGIGRAVTLDLAANGVAVAVLDRDPAGLEATAARLDGMGATSLLRDGDVRDPEVLDALFAAVDERFGRLDVLVNVPGGTFRAPFEETNPRGWETLLRTNLTHVLHACHRAIPRMRAGGRGGSIVNLTTIEAHRAAPGFAVYAAAKAAVTELARTLAVELAPDGIRINNVAPDITPTDNMRAIAAGAPSMLDHPLGASSAVPMGRFGDPTDVSGVVVFLASALSSYMTGLTLHPDGGTFASSGFLNWPGHGWGNTIPTDVLDLLSDRPTGDAHGEGREA